MPFAALTKALRLLVALALTAGLLSFGFHKASSHGPGSLAVVGTDMERHGHGHDHGPEDGPGDHDPVEHSHVTLSLPATPPGLPGTVGIDRVEASPCPALREPSFSLYRPPRPASVA